MFKFLIDAAKFTRRSVTLREFGNELGCVFGYVENSEILGDSEPSPTWSNLSSMTCFSLSYLAAKLLIYYYNSRPNGQDLAILAAVFCVNLNGFISMLFRFVFIRANKLRGLCIGGKVF